MLYAIMPGLFASRPDAQVMKRFAKILEAGVAHMDMVSANLTTLPTTPAVLAAMDQILGDFIAIARRSQPDDSLHVFLRHTCF